ncbi:MAG TPA: hypothetical protein VHA13_01345, partial [Gammaproteobacteria bacterium]|nr:hypothetical protein [Gammaproteobacteria bacterium]
KDHLIDSLDNDMIISISFSVSGSLAVKHAKTLHIWNPRSGKLVDTIDEYTGDNDDRLFDYGQIFFIGNNLLIFSGPWAIGLVDTTRKQSMRILDGFNSALTTMSWNKNGLLASGHHEGEVCLWDIKEMKMIYLLKIHTKLLNIIKLGADNLLASVELCSKNIYLWDIKDNKLSHIFEGHTGEITCIDLSSDNLLASSSEDNTIRLWDIRQKRLIHVFENNKAAGLSFGPNNLLASFTRYVKVQIWDAKHFVCLAVISDFQGFKHSIAWHLEANNIYFAIAGTKFVSYWQLIQQDKEVKTILLWSPYQNKLVLTKANFLHTSGLNELTKKFLNERGAKNTASYSIISQSSASFFTLDKKNKSNNGGNKSLENITTPSNNETSNYVHFKISAPHSNKLTTEDRLFMAAATVIKSPYNFLTINGKSHIETIVNLREWCSIFGKKLILGEDLIIRNDHGKMLTKDDPELQNILTAVVKPGLVLKKLNEIFDYPANGGNGETYGDQIKALCEASSNPRVRQLFSAYTKQNSSNRLSFDFSDQPANQVQETQQLAAPKH